MSYDAFDYEEPLTLPPGYAVTRDGRVYSHDSNWRGYGTRALSQLPDRDGYLTVRLTTATGRRKRFRVHRLVAETYLSPRPLGRELRHLDGNKTNNSAANLAWGTQAENAADRERHGRTSRGVKHSEAIKAGQREARQ